MDAGDGLAALGQLSQGQITPRSPGTLRAECQHNTCPLAFPSSGLLLGSQPGTKPALALAIKIQLQANFWGAEGRSCSWEPTGEMVGSSGLLGETAQSSQRRQNTSKNREKHKCSCGKKVKSWLSRAGSGRGKSDGGTASCPFLLPPCPSSLLCDSQALISAV